MFSGNHRYLQFITKPLFFNQRPFFFFFLFCIPLLIIYFKSLFVRLWFAVTLRCEGVVAKKIVIGITNSLITAPDLSRVRRASTNTKYLIFAIRINLKSSTCIQGSECMESMRPGPVGSFITFTLQHIMLLRESNYKNYQRLLLYAVPGTGEVKCGTHTFFLQQKVPATPILLPERIL